MKISSIDLVIIILYFLIIISVGIYISYRQRRIDSSEGFFLAGRSLSWVLVGTSLFAANISTIHMVGLAAQGFKDGLVWGNFEWMAAFLLIVLGLIFAPFYFKSKISTLPEFLEKRYSPEARSFLAFMAIVSALFMHIGVSLYAGAVVFENFFGVDMWTSILVISSVTIIYTALGGLKAVVITETIQTAILIIGATIMAYIAFEKLSDYGIYSMEDLESALKPHQLSMIQSHKGSPLPWHHVLLGYPVLGLYYWCADQTIVQKVLGAKTLNDAQSGPIFAGFIKILPVFIMVFPGVIAYVLFKDQIQDPNDTLPVIITQLLPVGLKGLISAALLAALMSTIAAALNSSGTLVSIDIVKRIYPGTSDKKLTMIGRITMLVVILSAIAWSPLIARFPSIFEAINSLLAVLSPPIATVFIIGVFWKRGNKEAGLWTLIFGFIIGAFTFILDFEPISGSMIVTKEWGIPFMMQAWWLFVICSGFYIIISLLTPKPSSINIEGLTLDRPMSFLLDQKLTKWYDARILALTLVLTMAVLYMIFW